MAYTKIVFQNSPSTATPLNAENLNHMDDQIALNDQRLTEIETSYVKSFNGRKGDVTAQSGDYNIGQIAPLTGAQVGQVPVVVNHGTEQDPELVFEMGAGGGAGGHEIIDSEGNTMPQESAMQFPDSHVSDDSTNGRTVVENVKEVASADYSSETEDGMYLIPDGEGAVIGPASDDVVTVEHDGTKTWRQLLNELFSEIDLSKVTDKTTLVGSDGSFFVLNYKSPTVVNFIHSEVQAYFVNATIQSSNSVYSTGTNGSVTDISGNIATIDFTLHYGNKKATVDLQTTANRCWYDSENTVKQKIDDISIKQVELTVSSDVNDCTDEYTTYYITGANRPINAPTNSAYNQMYWNRHFIGDIAICQFCACRNATELYMRFRWDNSWGSWVKISTTAV